VTIRIAKLGATGDVVRTTPILHRIGDEVVWLTEAKNVVLLQHLAKRVRCFAWEERALIPDLEYDLVINLEDTLEVAKHLQMFRCKRWFGAYADSDNRLRYTDDSRCWFDLSLISSYGREEADRLKLLNRSSYQELIFNGIGLRFLGEGYLLPEPEPTALSGDVAIASEAGPVWPMKNWAYYAQLKTKLESLGLVVNFLPKRASLLEHLADVQNHKCLVGGDSLPMHFALGTGTPCVTLFTCTSPWEIYDYGIQRKIISPLLQKFFYQRGYEQRATTAISLEEVVTVVVAALQGQAAKPPQASGTKSNHFFAETRR
jgi:ADP-heptose:LPS heptosyltransferase